MPIRQLLDGGSFGPDEIKVITAAFDGACEALGLRNREDPIVTLVAKKTLDIVNEGVSDAAEIQRRVIEALRR